MCLNNLLELIKLARLIRWRKRKLEKGFKLKKNGFELATEVGNVGTVRVDEVEIKRVDVADKVVDELKIANAHVDVGENGPQLKIWVLENL